MLAVALDQEEFVDRLRKTERELTQAASAEHAITVLDEAGCPSRIVGALVDVTDCGDRERP